MTRLKEPTFSDLGISISLNNTTHVRRNVIAVITRGMEIEDPTPEQAEKLSVFNANLESLVENAAFIEGLSRSYTYTPSGKVDWEPSIPVIGWVDRYDQPIRGFFAEAADLIRLNYGASRNPGFDMLFYEVDPTFTVVTDVWKFTNLRITKVMIPEGKRNVAEGLAVEPIKVRLFPNSTTNDEEAKAEAAKHLSKIKIASYNPTVRYRPGLSD